MRRARTSFRRVFDGLYVSFVWTSKLPPLFIFNSWTRSIYIHTDLIRVLQAIIWHVSFYLCLIVGEQNGLYISCQVQSSNHVKFPSAVFNNENNFRNELWQHSWLSPFTFQRADPDSHLSYLAAYWSVFL